MKCPKCGAALPEGAKFCGSCGARLTPPAEPTQQVTVKAPTLPVAPVPEEVTVVQPDLGAAAKKGPRGKLVGIAAAVVVLLVILAGLFFVLGRGGSGKNTYVLLQDGKYELMSSLKKADLVEIASAKSEDSADGLVRFSKDGKYLYFFTKYDSDDYTGTLCRAEYAKLKDGSSKNDKYITTIASNVKLWFYETKNGLLYNNDAGTLYYYNGSEAVQLAKNAYVIGKVDSDTNEILLYTRDNDDDTMDLYYVSLDKPEDPKKLEGKIDRVASTSDLKNILYAKGSDEDGYALYHTSIDGEPEKIANKYQYCYEDTTNGKFFYLKDTGKTVSLYDFVYDRYNVTEEPDWSDYRKLDSDGWYTYDDEGYSEAWDHYNLREDLTSEDNALPLYDLYCYANGQETLVAQDVLSNRSAGNGFIYWGVDVLKDQISIDDLDDAFGLRWTLSNLEDYFLDDMDASKLNLYSEAANTTVPLTEEAMEIIRENDYPRLYCVKDQIILSPNAYGEAGALYAATIKKGELGSFSQIADDAEIETYDEDCFYYITGEYDKGDNSYADLYCYENGESKRLAQDALGDEMVRVYKDGVISLYTDHNQNGYELTLLQKDGTKNLIADEVTEYLRVDKDTLLYLSDGDLYCYDGKEKKRVATDVDCFWAKSSAELDRSVWL